MQNGKKFKPGNFSGGGIGEVVLLDPGAKRKWRASLSAACSSQISVKFSPTSTIFTPDLGARGTVHGDQIDHH
jgi:hypothetical protein